MKPDEFLDCIRNLKTWKRGDQRAPHKPLLLLLALGNVQNQRPRLSSWTETQERLGQIFAQFGQPGKKSLDQPFKRLPGDKLWELTGVNDLPHSAVVHLTPTQLIQRSVAGGFPQEIHQMLQREPDLVGRAVELVLASHFPSSLHQEIKDSIGFTSVELNSAIAVDTVSRQRRNPAFRPAVLKAYRRRCAVCESNIRLEDEIFDLDAAHIKWHSHGGPSEVHNGLALCGFHHRAFDRGALGLEKDGTDFRVIIAGDIDGDGGLLHLLTSFDHKSILLPARSGDAPNPEFVEWHRDEVFRR